MQKYYDVVLGQGSNALMPVANASVTVLTSPGGVSATIYSDNGVTAATNPLTTAADGSFSFYAANGRYTLAISYLGVNKTLLDIVLEDDPTQANTVVITGGSVDNTPIGATTPNTGAFTTLNSAAGALNGSLGATTPSTVAATTIAASGTITPSQTSGIVGTTTNNNANAGSIGEIIAATAGATALTTATAANLTTISLTAGDWDVSGGVIVNGSAANLTDVAYGSSSVSASFGAIGTYSELTATMTLFGGAFPTVRYSLTTTTTIFLVGRATFAAGSASGQGMIRARRVR